MIDQVNILELPEDRFDKKSFNKINFKQRNIVYGKNGTGKSSIAGAIKTYCCESHDVRLFQGFESVIGENQELNAIVLGSKNNEVQKEIDKAKSDLEKANSDLTEARSKVKKVKNRRDNQKKKINDYCSKCASKLRTDYQQIAPRSKGFVQYNRPQFKESIKKAKKISKDEIERYTEILKENVIDEPISKLRLPKIPAGKYVQALNEILQTEIINNSTLHFCNDEEQNWVEKGYKLHSGKNTCIFCGGELTSNRMNDLSAYFDDSVNDLEHRIAKAGESFEKLNQDIDALTCLNKSSFYPELRENVEKLNGMIFEYKNKYSDFIEALQDKLSEKNKQKFTKVDILNLPNEADTLNGIGLKNEYDKLVTENKKLGDSIEQRQLDARKRIFYDRVYNLVNSKDFDYEEQNQSLEILEKDYNDCQNKSCKVNQEVNRLQNQLDALKNKQVNEQKAVDNINQDLKSLGNQSFELTNVRNSTYTGDEKGKYRIKNIGTTDERLVDTLSTGEKNIIAFLYFINDLKRVDSNTKHKIIIFDDPMNSNDDVYQYLIIEKLNGLIYQLKNEPENQLFIFTHNSFFYINMREQWWKGKPKCRGAYHLHKRGAQTEISEIDKKENDIKDNYDELWEELGFLYKSDKPNLMPNIIRRIFETYSTFNGFKPLDMFKIKTEKGKEERNNLQFKKYLDVNSHSIDDCEANVDEYSRDQVLKEMLQCFKNKGGEAHCTKHLEKIGLDIEKLA